VEELGDIARSSPVLSLGEEATNLDHHNIAFTTAVAPRKLRIRIQEHGIRSGFGYIWLAIFFMAGNRESFGISSEAILVLHMIPPLVNTATEAFCTVCY
jgi:hypothetical protein